MVAWYLRASVSAEASLFIRLYLDEDVHKLIAAALRLRGFDVVSAHEIGRWGFSDELQLTYASSEERAIFTYNASDYLELIGPACNMARIITESSYQINFVSVRRSAAY